MLVRGIDHFGVNLVRDDQDIMFDGEVRYLADHRGRRDCPGGVVGRDHHKHPRAWCDARLDVSHAQREIVCLDRRHRHRHPAAQMHGSVIGGETGRGDQNLIPRRDQCQHAQHDAFLHARCDHNLVGGVVEAVVFFQVLCDGGAQGRQAGGACIVMLIGIKGCLGGGDDMRRRVKIGIASA